jgi:tetrahydromethanopterin S-methyltransferase subunit B
MTTVRIAPEMHLVLDIDSATVAQENEGVLLYSLEPLVERLDKLDLVAEDLINSLSPSRPLMNTWPGREHTSYQAGFYTNAWYGIVVGFFFFGMVLLLLYLRTVMTAGGA